MNNRVEEWHPQMARQAADKARQRENEEDLADILGGAGPLSYRQSLFDESLTYYDAALSISKESLGDWHPKMAKTLNNIAGVYDSQSRYREALAYYEEALSIKKESLRDRHPSVTSTLHNTALLYVSQGRHGEALTYFEEALSIMKESFSNRHPDVAQTLNNIASVYNSQGRCKGGLARSQNLDSASHDLSPRPSTASGGDAN